jgi:hypothetical protein
MKAVHLGIPHGVTRYDLAATAAHLPGVTVGVNMANHGDFEGIAPRPMDTTFADSDGASTRENAKMTGQTIGTELGLAYIQAAHKSARLINAGISKCQVDLVARSAISVEQRAKELALFTGLREEVCLAKLNTGFHALHAAVAADFRNYAPSGASFGIDHETWQRMIKLSNHAEYQSIFDFLPDKERWEDVLKALKRCDDVRCGVSSPCSPQSDEELLDWYRTTDSYNWELSAYHCDVGVPPPGWNYSGMCAGVGDRLEAAGAKRILCLGDGIGDLTLALVRRGFKAVYHDLYGSRTAAFAAMRYWMYTGQQMELDMTAGWEPTLQSGYDAIVSLDFLEHCVGVPKWTAAIYAALKPGGLFMAQNAYGIGSGQGGSIPMHLTENDRYETEWDDLCAATGFSHLSSNWYQRPEHDFAVGGPTPAGISYVVGE